MHDQKSICDGFLRMEIVNNLSYEFTKIISTDVINLCHKFYSLNIKSLIEKEKGSILEADYYSYGDYDHDYGDIPDDEALLSLSRLACKNKEFFMGYKLLKMLINYDPTYGDYHNLLALSLRDWVGVTDETMSFIQKAIELAPENFHYVFNVKNFFGLVTNYADL